MLFSLKYSSTTSMIWPFLSKAVHYFNTQHISHPQVRQPIPRPWKVSVWQGDRRYHITSPSPCSQVCSCGFITTYQLLWTLLVSVITHYKGRHKALHVCTGVPKLIPLFPSVRSCSHTFVFSLLTLRWSPNQGR